LCILPRTWPQEPQITFTDIMSILVGDNRIRQDQLRNFNTVLSYPLLLKKLTRVFMYICSRKEANLLTTNRPPLSFLGFTQGQLRSYLVKRF
jgi:hypothetical protein